MQLVIFLGSRDVSHSSPVSESYNIMAVRYYRLHPTLDLLGTLATFSTNSACVSHGTASENLFGGTDLHGRRVCSLQYELPRVRSFSDALGYTFTFLGCLS